MHAWPLTSCCLNNSTVCDILCICVSSTKTEKSVEKWVWNGWSCVFRICGRLFTYRRMPSRMLELFFSSSTSEAYASCFILTSGRFLADCITFPPGVSRKYLYLFFCLPSQASQVLLHCNIMFNVMVRKLNCSHQTIEPSSDFWETVAQI